MSVVLALVSDISLPLLLILVFFPVFTFASDLTLFFFLDSCFPSNGRPRNIRREPRKTGKHSDFQREWLYLVILTVQTAIPGDCFSVCLAVVWRRRNCRQTLWPRKPWFCPADRKWRKEISLDSWLRFGLIWFSVSGVTCFLFQWGY